MSGEHVGIEVARYSEQYRQQWDDFIEQSQQGTLFHTRAFLAYHPPGRFMDESLLFFRKERLVAVLPAAVVLRDGKKILSSHPGASFGGFVLRSPLSVQETDHVVTAFLGYGREQGYASVELTLPPQFYFSTPHQHVEYALYRRGFRYRKREMTSVIAPDPLLASWSREARRAARRAEKRGVKIAECESWENFYTLLQQHMWKRHHVQPTHSWEELQRLRDLCPQRLRLFAAFVREEMIAGVLLFLCNRRAALAFYYVSQREGFEEYHGFYLLFAEVLQWCARQELSYLDFGTYTIEAQPNWGLAAFKESFGAQGVFRDTMFINLGAC